MEGVGVSFWAGRRVLLTGHTGFKGAWAGRWLAKLGAEVTGMSLASDSDPSLFAILGEDHLSSSHILDLRDADMTAQLVAKTQPEIVFHMAAQPLVRLSYADPVLTFGSNVMGTVHLLDALRRHTAPKAIVVVTSDKVYENNGSGLAHQEGDRLGGHDPYSASKAATEIVVSSYRRSYFSEAGIPIVTARGGNVIGGGDFSVDRIVPDIVRAMMEGQEPKIRNPAATRPWQHVLDCLDGYFTFAVSLAQGGDLPNALNFGPLPGRSAVTVGDLTNRFLLTLGRQTSICSQDGQGPHEMSLLSIDPSLTLSSLQWRPRLDSQAAIDLTARWYEGFISGKPMNELTDTQIDAFRGRK